MDPNSNPFEGSADPGTSQPNQTPDAPDRETMEKIRLRRLAKLGTTTKATDPSESHSGSNPPSTSAEPTKPSRSQLVSPSASSSILKAAAENKTAKPVTGRLGTKRHREDHGIDSSSSEKPIAPPTRKAMPVQLESLQDYTDRILQTILQATVDPENHTLKSNKNVQLTFLPNLSAELASENQPLKLNTGILDSAILEATSIFPQSKPLLHYLLPAWSRAQTLRRTPTRDMTSEKTEVLEEAKRMCISNCMFALAMPMLFGRDSDEDDKLPAQYLAQSLILHPTDSCGIDDEFLKEAIGRFDEVEGLSDVFAEALHILSLQVAGMTMESDYRGHLNALLLYSKFPDLLRIVAEHPAFLGAENGPDIQTNTILGPFFNLSPLRTASVKVFFPSPRTMDKAAIARSQDSMRMTLQALQIDLLGVINAFVRVDSKTRGKTLDWFALVVNKNHKRRAMQYKPEEVSSDSLMVNATRILDFLCEPFMDTSFNKMDKINADYFRQNPRVAISDETKINADEATSNEYYAQTIPGSSHFISEVFFLALAAHHYGIESVSTKLRNMDREIKYFEKNLAKMEAERPKFANNPAQRAHFESVIARHREFIDIMTGKKHSIEGIMMDQKMQETSLRFMRYVAVWLLRVGSQSDYIPGRTITLPLPQSENRAFSCLPEYALQNVVDNFKFVYRYVPQILSFSTGPELMVLCITFLQCSELIKNPYLKSSLVTLLFSGTWPISQYQGGVMTDLLASSDFANKHLLHALIKFYIECENTGVSSQFYDKFNIRYEIFQVIKTVWSRNEVYSKQLKHESKVNREFFVQFVNLLLNDTTYVLDEAMGKFPRIRALEKELASDAPNTLSQEDRQKKDDELQQLASSATSYMQLANETLEMMKLFTSALKDAFIMPEIVYRLASMMNYNLETLAGPKGGQLKVTNPEKYHFRPIQLLSDFIDIYINLGSSPDFIEAVAADGRSYKPLIFDRAYTILSNKSMKDPTELKLFAQIKDRFFEAKAEADQAELDLGDIPAEFEDPILGDLMKDPVLLPSQNIVDRSTIVQHLLSDAKDPFTRQPMTIDDVIPDSDLKDRISKWKEEKLAAAKQRLKDMAALEVADELAPGPDAMDTTE
ncbi:Ubiquitin conjugation factor E4 [Ceratocystis lukuohia]|uniref:peptidylprolyl isomerase n=1 Tax=Ceratocystis lukuohia TaxID=2019550 RepID=A0ABR4MSF4_9PEZI